MLSYCVGDVYAKRRAFRSGEGVSVDNEDVLVTYSLNGKLYYVIGDNPYGAFSVGEYLSYSRSLINRRPLNFKEVRFLLKEVGCKVNPWRKISSLDRIALKEVLLSAKLEIDTKTIYINFDGLEFKSKTHKKLNKFLDKLKRFDVYVAVSDTRFVPKGSITLQYLGDGAVRNITEYSASSKRSSKRAARKILKKRGLELSSRSVKSVVALTEKFV